MIPLGVSFLPVPQKFANEIPEQLIQSAVLML